MPGAGDKSRVDKWLWQARFFKTRGLATKLVTAGKLRVNSIRVTKPAYMIRPGDVLTFAQARRIRVVQVLAMADRRGPAPEAQALYDDQTPAVVKPPIAHKPERMGRPTKKQRREARLLRPDYLE